MQLPSRTKNAVAVDMLCPSTCMQCNMAGTGRQSWICQDHFQNHGSFKLVSQLVGCRHKISPLIEFFNHTQVYVEREARVSDLCSKSCGSCRTLRPCTDDFSGVLQNAG